MAIQWWVPPKDKERVSGGPSRMTVDLFGQWHSFEQIKVDDVENYEMAPTSMPRSPILYGPIGFDDGKIPFQT